MISIFLPFILCCTGYAQHEDSISQTPEDTIPIVVTTDSISLVSEDIDWNTVSRRNTTNSLASKEWPPSEKATIIRCHLI